MRTCTSILCGLVALATSSLVGLASAQPAPTAPKPAAKAPAPPAAGAPVGTPPTGSAPKKAPPGKPGAPPPTPPAEGAAGAGDAPPCPPGAVCEATEMVPPEELYSRDGGDETAAYAAERQGSAGATTVVIPPPPPGSDPNAPRWVMVKPSPDGGAGQVIVMEPGAAPPHGADTWDEPVRPVPPPPPPPEEREWHRFRMWGMNLRVEGMLLPRRTYHTYRDDGQGAGLIGLGLGLRFRPVDIFALEAATDFFAGYDTNDYARREIPLNLTAIFYVNPDDVVQFMAFGGANFAFAQVFSDHTEANLAQGDADEYTYLGGHLGCGLEFRVSELIGIDIDGYGLLRTRTDTDFGGKYPEYIDEETGNTSNTTVAAVLRGGLTFWW